MNGDLHARINSMRSESRDPAFTRYLNDMEARINEAEKNLDSYDKSLTESYEKYKKAFSAEQAPVVPPVQQTQTPAVPPVDRSPVVPVVPPAQQTQAPVVPPVQQPGSTSIPVAPAAPVNSGYAPVGGPAPFAPNPNPPYIREAKPAGSMEFKIGTIILSVVGVMFVLAALILFGVNYMHDTVVQGVFFYVLGAVIILVSELVFAKRIEKFSYVLTGLGIGGIYVTTVLSYVYLKIFPGWVAAIITLVITAFFFYFSRKKNSEIIRIISLLGCYLSVMPLKEIEGFGDWLMPSVMVVLVSIAGIYFPVKEKRSVVADYIQTLCMLAVILKLDYVLGDSAFSLGEFTGTAGYSSWLSFIMLMVEMVLAHLLYAVSRKREDDNISVPEAVLYFITESYCYIVLLTLLHDAKWLYFGVLAPAVITPVFVYMLRKSKLKYVPYFYLMGFMMTAFFMEEDTFWFTLTALVFFAINKLITRFEDQYHLFDAIYSTWLAGFIIIFAREDDVRFLGYIAAACIIIGAVLSVRYKKYLIYMAVTFAWLFLLTEDCEPFLSSILVTVLALIMIFAGFIKKDKGIRIYGLCLVIAVAFKIVLFDFAHSETSFRILVFLIVGILIIGVSLLYIVFEKREIQAAAAGQGIPDVPVPPQPFRPVFNPAAPMAQGGQFMQQAAPVVQPVVQPVQQNVQQPVVQPAQQTPVQVVNTNSET